jgi:hypothetical protein
MSLMSLTISEDFLLEIGRVSVLQSHIEGGLAIIITNLAGVERAVGDVFTKYLLSFKNLAETATSLLKLRAAEIGQRGTHAAELIDRAWKAEDRRNQFVHSMWSYGPDFDRDVVTRLKLSGRPPELKAHTVSIDDVRGLAAEMEEISNGMMYIHPFLQCRPPTT